MNVQEQNQRVYYQPARTQTQQHASVAPTILQIMPACKLWVSDGKAQKR